MMQMFSKLYEFAIFVDFLKSILEKYSVQLLLYASKYDRHT